MKSRNYNGEIVAGSLLVKESRHVAALLLSGADEKTFHQAIVVDNVLQKRSPASAKRMLKLIRKRLEGMSSELWLMVRDGNQELATQALLCAAIKHSHLLGDFLNSTIRSHKRTFKKQLTLHDWSSFFEECQHLDPEVGDWVESTLKKIRQVVFRILAEAKVIDSTKLMTLLPFSLHPDINKYLSSRGEDYVLKCLESIQ